MMSEEKFSHGTCFLCIIIEKKNEILKTNGRSRPPLKMLSYFRVGVNWRHLHNFESIKNFSSK